MRTLVWILVWVVLVVAAGLYLWRALKASGRVAVTLGDEVARASEQLSAVQAQVDRLGEATDRLEELAVFGDPTTLRRERAQGREALAKKGRGSRQRDLPTWARRVDS